MWLFFNDLKSIFPTKLKVSSPRTDDVKHRVNCFVEYFSTVVSVLKKSAYPLIDFVWRYPKKTRLRTKSIFKFSYVSSVFVEKELRNLKRNKAAGVDCLPPNLLKDYAPVIGKPVQPIVKVIEQQVCSLVIKCLNKDLCHETFDEYFEVQRHKKRTRNNDLCLKLPALKLEFARSSFYYGGAKV